MSVTLPTLDSLDQATVDQCRKLLTALILEYNPQVSVQRGVINDLVLHPRAVLNAAYEQRLSLLAQSGSLLAITQNPALADPATVDRLLSNFRLVRRLGTAAVGTVTIVLSSQTPAVVPQNTVFTINGLTYTPDQVYAARASGTSILGPGDRLLTPMGTGQWSFTIGVVATAAGAAGNANFGAPATMTPPVARFVKAFAAASFTGGTDAETNTQLLTRLLAGLAAQGWSSRPGIESLLRSQAALPGIKAVSVVGFGDAEMRRDQHSLWPVSGGGRCNVYLRSDDLKTILLSRTATLVSRAGTVGTWQFGIGRDDVPGYYEIIKVVRAADDPTTAGFVPSSDTRAFDLTGGGVLPDVTTATEAAYSRFQTATVQFADTVTNATSLTIGVSTAAYTVVVRGLPAIDVAHDFLADRGSAPPMGDVLVKAPVPCFLAVSFTVSLPRGVTTPTTGVIQQAVASFVNGLGFPGQLSGSAISQVVHGAVPAALGLTRLDMLGRIRRPDGTASYVRSGDLLQIPNDPVGGVTGRTVSFFLDPADVAVTFTTVDMPTG